MFSYTKHKSSSLRDFQLMTLSRAFIDDAKRIYVAKMSEHKEKEPQPDARISDSLFKLLQKCWAEDPIIRPKAEELLRAYLALPLSEREVQSGTK
jgi:hypothetical protein